jgi:phage-related protein
MTGTTRRFDGTLPFRVVSMKPERADWARRLEQAMRHGLTAVADPSHRDFYTVEIDGTAYYFHVFEKHGTAYLVASNARSACGRAHLDPALTTDLVTH